MTDCYIDSSGCTVCPGYGASSGFPETISQTPAIGWGTGAYSSVVLDGDLHVVFTMQNVNGAACGLQKSSGLVGEPSAIDFGILFHGGTKFNLIESGNLIFNDASYADGDTFEVRRSNELVTYWRNNALLYTSAKRSVGPLFVAGALYVSGDQIG